MVVIERGRDGRDRRHAGAPRPTGPTPEQRAAHREMRDRGHSDVWTRGRDEITALFDGLELVAPGVVPVSEWRPEPGAVPMEPRDVAIWGAVARKP